MKLYGKNMEVVIGDIKIILVFWWKLEIRITSSIRLKNKNITLKTISFNMF